jgi:hypothetical protein
MSPIRRAAFTLIAWSCCLSTPVRAESNSASPAPSASAAEAPSDAVAQTSPSVSPAAQQALPRTEPGPSESRPATTEPAARTEAGPPESRPTVEPVAEPARASTTPAVPLVPARFKKPTLGWDVNLEGGYGRYFADPAERFGFARARAGLLYSVDPLFYAVGITYDWSNLTAATFGLQAEVMHIESGLWAQAGALLDTQVHPGVMGSVGWSIFGAEIQYRKFDPNNWGPVVVGKLRIPVTFIAKAFE